MLKGRASWRASAPPACDTLWPQPFLLALALLNSSQDKLVGVGSESLDHPENAKPDAKVRLGVRIEPGKLLRVQEEIGIPEVHLHQSIKVNREARATFRARGHREIERILGRRQ